MFSTNDIFIKFFTRYIIFSQITKGNGLTQKELVEKLGVTTQAVSIWENELSCPDY